MLVALRVPLLSNLTDQARGWPHRGGLLVWQSNWQPDHIEIMSLTIRPTTQPSSGAQAFHFPLPCKPLGLPQVLLVRRTPSACSVYKLCLPWGLQPSLKDASSLGQ